MSGRILRETRRVGAVTGRVLVYVLILNKMGALKRVFGFRLPGVSGPKKPVKAGHQDNSHAINNPKQRGYKSRYKHFK